VRRWVCYSQVRTFVTTTLVPNLTHQSALRPMVNLSLDSLHPSLTQSATIYRWLKRLLIAAFARKFASPEPLGILHKRIAGAP
jgi:hypothetical protein